MSNYGPPGGPEPWPGRRPGDPEPAPEHRAAPDGGYEPGRAGRPDGGADFRIPPWSADSGGYPSAGSGGAKSAKPTPRGGETLTTSGAGAERHKAIPPATVSPAAAAATGARHRRRAPWMRGKADETKGASGTAALCRRIAAPLGRLRDDPAVRAWREV